jgi:hypothetical protein
MSHELVYTSAPQGLKPGSRGFCTVVSTAGMTRNLTERLESFSGYRHAFMAHEAEAGQNPVNFAHYHTTIAGQKYHILSRIADAGLDYTQRSNKLAHHVALEPGEAVAAPGGPAWVMAAEGFFVERWDGQVRTLPAGSQPVRSDRPAQVCQRWKQLTGDAGWGGVLAESGLRNGSVMSVIFPVGTPVLELVIEALALLPCERRWQVTFSTYFTKAPAGIDCQWRFLLDGTPEATALRRDVRATVIDLCQPLGRAPDGDLVEMARTGVFVQRGESRGAAPAQRVAAVPPRTPSGPPVRGAASADLRLAPPVPPPSAAGSTVPSPDWLTPSRTGAGRHWMLFASGAVLLVAVGLILGAVLFGGGEPVKEIQIADVPQTPETAPVLVEEPLDAPPEEQPEEPPPEEQVPEMPTDEPVSEPKDPDPGEPEQEKPPPDPFQEIRQRGNRLSLPPLTISEGVGAFANSRLNKEKVELVKIDVEEHADLDLQLDGNESKPRREQDKYYVKTVDEENVRRWEVTTEQPTAVGGTNEIKPVATFTLKDGSLHFNWENAQPLFRVAYCTLTLTAYDRSETCYFEWMSDPVPSIQLRNEAPARYDLPTLSRFSLRPDDQVSLELKFTGIPGSSFSENGPQLTLQNNQTAIRIPLESYYPNTANPQASVVLSLQAQEGDTGAIEQLWIESKPRGPAPTMEQTEQLVAAQWKREHWKKGEIHTDLSDEGIKKHYDQGKLLEAELKRFMTYCERNTTFKLIRKWAAEPLELQQIAVGTFATLEQQIKENERKLNDLDNRNLQLEQIKPTTPEGRANWQNEKAENRKQAKELANNLHTRRTERDQLNAEHGGQLSEVYHRYELSNPEHLKSAKMHLFFQGYLDELNVWHEGMNRFVKDLRNNGRLHYRLSVMVDERRVDLLMTEGFVDQPSSVAEAN